MADTLWIWILLNILETGIYIALILGMMPDIRSLGKAERLTAILIFALMAVLSGARQRIGSLFSPLAYFYTIFILITGTFLIYRRQLCLIIGTVLTYCSLTMLTVYLTVFFLSAIQTKNAYSGIYGFFGENINESFSFVRGVVLAVSLIIVWRLNHHDVRRQACEYRIVLLAAGIVLSALVLEYQNLLEYGVMYSAADIPAVKAVLRDSMLSMITSLVLLAVLGTLYLKNRRIDPFSKKKAGQYSLGMRERLGIAQAIMEDPDLLILDEPFNGLDKRGADEVCDLLDELRARGKTILIAAHNMPEIEYLCDTISEMDAGRLTQIK